MLEMVRALLLDRYRRLGRGDILSHFGREWPIRRLLRQAGISVASGRIPRKRNESGFGESLGCKPLSFPRPLASGRTDHERVGGVGGPLLE
jgi:hypothetical protein